MSRNIPCKICNAEYHRRDLKKEVKGGLIMYECPNKHTILRCSKGLHCKQDDTTRCTTCDGRFLCGTADCDAGLG
jgi:hypothetical protein